MPLIKIDKDRYINSDKIVAILPRHALAVNRSQPEPNEPFVIILGERLQIQVASSVVDYLTQTIDTNDAAVFDIQPQQLPLASRLALFLREQGTGQTLNDLTVHFLDEVSDVSEITEAINELLSNNVVVTQYGNDQQLYFYHTANSPLAGLQKSLDPAGW